MPKMITKFQCDVCKAFYDFEEDCLDCEKSHLNPVAVHKPTYDCREAGKYPKSVVVQLEDSEGRFIEATYYRKDK